MRCYICDRVLKDPEFNQDHGGYEPCPTCLSVIEDLLSAYRDKPSADDDDLPDDYDWLLLYAETGDTRFLEGLVDFT